MLTERNVNIGFIVLMASVVVADLFLFIHLFVYILIILAYIAILAWGTSVIQSGFWLKAYCSGNPENKTIGLSFDDGPDRKITPAVLEILATNNIKAAFFCIGEKVDREPELVKRISGEGHIVGNHSYTHHFFFDLSGRKKMKAEILRTENIIREVTGRDSKLFRPPYGVLNPPLARVLKEHNYKVIGWSLRSKDTVVRDSDQLIRTLSSRLKNGDIILFHDRLEHVPDILEKFINLAKSHGYSFERPDLLLKINSYE